MCPFRLACYFDCANNNNKKDHPYAFCGNGIEIDLKELEILERRVAAKKRANAERLEINENANDINDQFEKSLKISNDSFDDPPMQVLQQSQPTLASMFLVVMSIFSILNQIYFKPTAQS